MEKIIGKTFQNDVREKEKGCSQKNKKDRKLKEDDIKKVVLFIRFIAPFNMIGKMMGF